MVPLPRVTAQLTAVLDKPETAAVNCNWLASPTDAFAGETAIATVCGTLTITSAEADFVVSALLRAVIV